MYSCRRDIDFSVPGSSRANRACSWAMSAWEDLWTFCVYKDKKTHAHVLDRYNVAFLTQRFSGLRNILGECQVCLELIYKR